MNGAADADAVFSGAPARVDAGAAEPYALVDGMTLTVRVDSGDEETVIFSAADFADIGAASAVEVAAAINAVLTAGHAAPPGGSVRISSQLEGTASRVEITGGTANAVLQLPTAPVVGTGNVANLASVSVAEVRAVVEAAIPTVQVAAGLGDVLELRTIATGSAASIQANAATAAAFGFDTTLHTGSDSGSTGAIRVEGRDPTSPVTSTSASCWNASEPLGRSLSSTTLGWCQSSSTRSWCRSGGTLTRLSAAVASTSSRWRAARTRCSS